MKHRAGHGPDRDDEQCNDKGPGAAEHVGCCSGKDAKCVLHRAKKSVRHSSFSLGLGLLHHLTFTIAALLKMRASRCRSSTSPGNCMIRRCSSIWMMPGFDPPELCRCLMRANGDRVCVSRAPPRAVEKFYREYESQVAPFVLYGSGDFHYLTALWLRRVMQPVVVVSFDNHPDWDIRPPKWGCGGWVNRALELPNVQRVSVWGCGNFECWWPHQIFGNRRAERAGRLEVHPWADGRSAKDRQRRGAILRENWREHFERFASDLRGSDVYVTIDLDCLRAEEAVTNWESGRFTIVDLAWALGKLRESSRIVGGDICGAYSEPNIRAGNNVSPPNSIIPKLHLRPRMKSGESIPRRSQSCGRFLAQ